MATTRFVFTPESAHFPSSNPASLMVQATTLRPVLRYDATTDQYAYWTFAAPQGMSGALSAIVTYYMDTATSGTVEWEVSVEAISDGESTTADSFDTLNTSGGVTVPGTAGLLDQISVTLTNADSIAVADYARLRVARNADTDTASGYAMILEVELREA